MQENPIRDDDIRGLIINTFAHDVQNLRNSSNTDEATRIKGSTHQKNINVEDYIQPSADESAQYHNLMKDVDVQLYLSCKIF